MANRKYVILNSNDSADIYPDNTWSDFTVALSDPLTLNKGKWFCALGEIFYQDIEAQLFVFADICTYSHVLGTQLPLLRRIYNSGELINPYFVEINRKEISSIRIYIRNNKGEIPDLSISSIDCTLVFKGLNYD